MTRLDIHPEHLIDRVLRGTASEAERSELWAHVRGCSLCSAERELGLSLREPLAGELETTSTAVDAAIAALVGAGRLAAPPVPAPSGGGHRPSGARAWMPWAVAACLFFSGSAAAATLIMAVRGSDSSPKAAPEAPTRVVHKRVEAKRVAKPSAAAVPAAESPPPEQAEVTTPNAPSSPSARARRRQPALLDAADLFADARAAALRGEFTEAAALYTSLQKRFASSPQAHVSRVVLGRLYLEHLVEPRSALAQFDAYLVQGGANRPEALLGRARALRALGRVQEEVETLRTLVDAYPQSLYVAPAEERLRAAQ